MYMKFFNYTQSKCSYFFIHKNNKNYHFHLFIFKMFFTFVKFNNR